MDQQEIDSLKSNPTVAEIIDSLAKDKGGNTQGLHVYSDDEISTARIPFDVVEPYPGGAAGATRTIAHLVLRAGTKVRWFNYGNSGATGQYPDGLGSASKGLVQATDVDTSLEKASVLSSGEERAILGIACACVDKFVKYDTTDVTVSNAEALPVDADVLAAYKGDVAMGDPSALAVGDVYDSPFVLENYLFEAFKSHARLFFKFDRSDPSLIGDMDQIPAANASSYLRASGEPSVDNFLKLPNGYRWAGEGFGGHELTVIAEVLRPIVIPFSLVALWAKAANAGGLPIPKAIAIAARMRLIGPRMGFKSNNG